MSRFDQAKHLLHPEQPYLRSEEEVRAFLLAQFPEIPEVVVALPRNEQGMVGVGVGAAFGIGETWDSAVRFLMQDEAMQMLVNQLDRNRK